MANRYDWSSVSNLLMISDFANFTWIFPVRILVSNFGWCCVAGPCTTLPSFNEKTEPCHGHFTHASSESTPSDNGPPRCEQECAIAYTCPDCLASKTGIPLTSAQTICPSLRSSSV